VFSPEDAFRPILEWSSNDDSVVTVNNYGVATAVAKGNAIVQVKTTGYNLTAFCEILVTAKAQKKEPPPPEIEVPNLYNKTYISAEKELQGLGLRINKKTFEHSSTVQKDSIISQSPSHGTMVLKDQIISVTVSLGKEPVLLPEKIEVPNVYNMTYASAEKDLQRLGLTINKLPSEYSSTVQKDSIISQLPSHGTMVQKGQIISVTVSLGKAQEPPLETTIVPNIVGCSIDVGRSLLAEKGLYLGEVNQIYSDEQQKGSIVRQSPSNGSIVQKWSYVDIELSLDPSELQQQSPKVYMIYVIDYFRADAINALSNRNINYRIEYEYGNYEKDDYVIKQTPQEGEEVGKNITAIITVGVRNPSIGSKTKIKKDNSNINESNVTIEGDNNTITGSNNIIIGDNNKVTGDENTISGDNSRVKGNGNTITGDNNIADGNNNKLVSGDNNIFNGTNNTGPDENNNRYNLPK
jgi:beta-lactam-binding protein with PASTA domain